LLFSIESIVKELKFGLMG